MCFQECSTISSISVYAGASGWGVIWGYHGALSLCHYVGKSTYLWIVLVRKDCSPALDSVISVTALFPRDRVKLRLAPHRASYRSLERSLALICATSIHCSRASTNRSLHAEGRYVARYMHSAVSVLPAQHDTLAICFYRCVGRCRPRRNASEWSGPWGRPSLIQESLYVR